MAGVCVEVINVIKCEKHLIPELATSLIFPTHWSEAFLVAALCRPEAAESTFVKLRLLEGMCRNTLPCHSA